MKTAKSAAKSKSSKAKSAKSTKAAGKKSAAAAASDLPKLEPDHPNFDTILLRRARLAIYRERRRKNRPDLTTK